jgi:hypothetical protein
MGNTGLWSERGVASKAKNGDCARQRKGLEGGLSSDYSKEKGKVHNYDNAGEVCRVPQVPADMFISVPHGIQSGSGEN